MIFITGCNGLVGSELARQLLDEGKQIIALRRPSSDMSLVNDIADKIQWIEGDIHDIPVLNKAMEQCTSVIHAAAVISFSPKQREKMYFVNVEGTKNVVNAALNHPIQSFGYISSIAAIGRKKNVFTVDEESLWEDSELNTHYAKSKYLAELEVWRAIEEGLPAFIVNPSVVLGPGNWENGSTKIFKYVYDRNKYYTKGYINYVDVQDVVRPMIELHNRKIVGERFILNAGHATYQELFNAIARSFQIQPPSVEVGKFLSEFAWRFEKIRSLWSEAEPILTKETVKLAGYSFEYKNDKIKNFLSYNFSSLQSTVDAVCKKLLQEAVNK